jgi:phage-related minor tail protein
VAGEKIGLKAELDDADFRKGVENYSSSLNDMDKQTGGIASSLTSAFGAVATGVVASAAIIGAAMVASLAAFGAAAFAAGQVYDDAVDDIIIKTGATGPVLDQLTADFNDVFTSIPTDAATASGVIGTLNARLGLTGDALTGVAEPLLEVTRMLGGDATTNTELFTRVMGDWSISNEDASTALDTMFVATQQTGIGLDKLMGNVVQFGSPLRLMGFTLNESVAMFAKWEAEGVNAELVMGSLRIAAGKFADQGVSLSEGLWKSYDAIKNNSDASKALSIAMDVFGARAGPDMAAAIREGRFEIEDLMAAMEGADGAIMNTAASTEGIAEKMKLLKNNAISALEPVGTAFLGVAAGVLDGLMPALQTLSGVFTTTIAPAIAGAMPGITNFIQNGLAKMVEWLQVWLPIAIENVSAFWTNTLQPALATVSNFVITSLIPALVNIWNFLATIIPPALAFLSRCVVVPKHGSNAFPAEHCISVAAN